MTHSDLRIIKAYIDALTPYALYSERIDALLTWLYAAYADALSLDALAMEVA